MLLLEEMAETYIILLILLRKEYNNIFKIHFRRFKFQNLESGN